MSQKTARRLLVTGHNPKGRSCVVSDRVMEGDEIPGRDGMEINQIWGSDGVMRYPDRGAKPAYTSFFPPLNGFRMLEMYLPGNTVSYDDKADNTAAMETVLPGHAATLDRERPGMHRSATLDMGYIVEGRCVLELDDGQVTLKAGDVLIQSGTMHRWFNPFDEPCRFIGFMVGAKIEDNR